MRERRTAAYIALALVATGCSSAVESSGEVATPAAPTSAAASPPVSTIPVEATSTAPPTGDGTEPPADPDDDHRTAVEHDHDHRDHDDHDHDHHDHDDHDRAATRRLRHPVRAQVYPGETLDDIVALFDDDTVDVETIMAENGLETPELVAGQLLDVCVDNGLNDIDGTTRTERNSVVSRREVEAQQTKLNALFAGYGIRELLVDGISGPVTRQRLCAFRLSANLPVSTDDMVAGSEEEALLMATETLGIPFTSAILADRWALIDETCQIMFVGVGTERLQFVFPTSTGLADFPTRPQVRSEVFKYDPAIDNLGWHDSIDFPAAEDNPLNGNMYKPLYFDGGQAIHGANNVPRSPASHGCARLRLDDMDALVDWLGLGDARGVTYNESRIDLAVNVQGRYVDR